VNFKDPEEELEEFLAAQPSWLRKILQRDLALSPDEVRAWLESNWWQDGGDVEREYLRLLCRIPAKWREYRKRLKAGALIGLPSRPAGRPRRDSLAHDARLLQQAGKSPAEIAVLLRKKHAITTPKGLREPTPEGIRKLLSSRKHGADPDKT
jgi:hypothetical protein